MTDSPPRKRQRKKKPGPLIEGDPFLTADVFTHEMVTKVDRFGRQITEEVQVPLVWNRPSREHAPVSVPDDPTDLTGGPRDEHYDYQEQYDEAPVPPRGTRTVGYVAGFKHSMP